MRITSLVLSTFLSLDLDNVSAFSPSRSFRPAAAINADAHITYNGITSTSALHAIGLGPGEDEQSSSVAIAEQPADVEVEIDHEQYRTSRLSKIDEQCDEWYGALLGTSDEITYLGDVSVEARKRILTLPELKKAVSSEMSFNFTRRLILVITWCTKLHVPFKCHILLSHFDCLCLISTHAARLTPRG